jgi:hypothetical protein
MPRSRTLLPLLLCLTSVATDAAGSPWPAGSGVGIAIPGGELDLSGATRSPETRTLDIEACTQVDFANDEIYTLAEDQGRLAS